MEGYAPSFRRKLVSHTWNDKMWTGYPIFGSFAAFCGFTIDVVHEDGTFSLFRSPFVRNASAHLHYAAFRVFRVSPVARATLSVLASPSNFTTRVLVREPTLSVFIGLISGSLEQDEGAMRAADAELALSDPRVNEGAAGLRGECADITTTICATTKMQRLWHAAAACSVLALPLFLLFCVRNWRAQRSVPEKRK